MINSCLHANSGQHMQKNQRYEKLAFIDLLGLLINDPKYSFSKVPNGKQLRR